MHLQLDLLTQKDSPEHNKHSRLQKFFRLNTSVIHSTISCSTNSQLKGTYTKNSRKQRGAKLHHRSSCPIKEWKINYQFHRGASRAVHTVIPRVENNVPKVTLWHQNLLFSLATSRDCCSVLQVCLIFCCFYLLLVQRCAICSFGLTWSTTKPHRGKIKLF